MSQTHTLTVEERRSLAAVLSREDAQISLSVRDGDLSFYAVGTRLEARIATTDE